MLARFLDCGILAKAVEGDLEMEDPLSRLQSRGHSKKMLQREEKRRVEVGRLRGGVDVILIRERASRTG